MEGQIVLQRDVLVKVSSLLSICAGMSKRARPWFEFLLEFYVHNYFIR